MDETYLKNLETAAHIIMAPPNSITNQQRQESETLFTNFRKTKAPYALCQTVLEKSSVDLVLFEAADVLKKAIVGEWKFIAEQDRVSLRQYLLNYVINRDIPVFIRDKLLQVVAIMIKRASLEDHGIERGQIIEETKKMLTSGDLKQQILSCSIMLAVLEEYCTIVRSDDTGLNTLEHFKAKKQFEDSDLLKTFVMTLQAMVEVVSAFDATNSVQLYFFKQLLTVMETVLTWGFLLPNLQNVRVMHTLSKRIIDTSETVTKALHAPPLRLQAQWKSVILDPKVMEVFFHTYWKTREIDDLQPKALICILQLSTLRGPIITENIDESMAYLANYLTHFLSMLTNIEIKDKEAYSFSLILRKLFQFLPAGMLKMLPNSLFDASMQQCFTMTMKFFELSAAEESASPDEALYIDALSNMLGIWLSFLNDKQNYPIEPMLPYITQMFEKYVQCHLAPPQGVRGCGSRENDGGENEISDIDEPDRERFKEQLAIMGFFGREILLHALGLLAGLLEDRTRKLGTHLHMLHASQSLSISGVASLVNLFEDIHWLLLISGHVMAMESVGEVASIPNVILSICAQQVDAGVTDVSTSLKLLASPNQDIQELPNAEANVDPVLRLMAAGFRLCELEKTAIEVRMYQFLSPELSTTLLWFLRHWCDSYVMTIDKSTANNIFSNAFGVGTGGALWVINYLLNKICLNAQHLRAEQGVMEESIELLLALQRNKVRSQTIFNSEYFRSICDLKSFELQSSVKRKLLRGFVTIASSVEGEEIRTEYITRIVQGTKEKYSVVLTTFQQQAHVHQSEQFKEQVIEVLEETIGCVQGAFGSLMTILFHEIQPICKQLASFMSVYKNDTMIVELVLELLNELEQSADVKMVRIAVHQYSMDVISVYVKNNTNRISLDPTNNERDPQDLILILKLINGLSMRNVVNDDDEETIQQASDVCIYGLTNIVPLITAELIRYPELCYQYYITITTFVESKSYVVPTLHPDFLKQMVSSVELGLTSFTSDVELKCLEFIEAFAQVVLCHQNSESQVAQLLQSFLKLMLDMTIGRKIDCNNTTDWYKAMFSVVCCFPQTFKDLVQSFLQEHVDSSTDKAKEMINESLMRLNQIEFINVRLMKIRFVDWFDRFVSLVSLTYRK
ncbi:exportin-4-like [Anopheles bellator]|uniref:exportin-4-like n=1 Tax=Anopheles bellator TaxID=139047 RepID=UPI0026481E69|nr:exportin-4-like [Anopheles bellator]